MKKTVICLIGPTASGKTEVALQLAKQIGAEIISCDSMQVYKGTEIASSQPITRQRKEVVHHLIAILNPSQEYNAARFKTATQKIINDIHRRNKLPLIVGGTGLYLKALLDGLFSGPGQNIQLRKKFYQQAKKYGPSYLYCRLKNKDPQSASKIHPHDLRRLIRALEVYELSGRPISQLKKDTRGIRDNYNVYIFGLRRKREQLYARIEKRVEEMFRQGLVAETEKLAQSRPSKTARSLLGYKEIIGFLKGEYSFDEAKRLLKRNTRRYAKRQISWFKKEKGVTWIDVGAKDTAKDVAKKMLSFLSTNSELRTTN